MINEEQQCVQVKRSQNRTAENSQKLNMWRAFFARASLL